MAFFNTFARGLFGTAPKAVHKGPQVTITPFSGVAKFFVGHHEKPHIPIAPVKHPPLKSLGVNR